MRTRSSIPHRHVQHSLPSTPTRGPVIPPISPGPGLGPTPHRQRESSPVPSSRQLQRQTERERDQVREALDAAALHDKQRTGMDGQTTTPDDRMQLPRTSSRSDGSRSDRKSRKGAGESRAKVSVSLEDALSSAAATQSYALQGQGNSAASEEAMNALSKILDEERASKRTVESKLEVFRDQNSQLVMELTKMSSQITELQEESK